MDAVFDHVGARSAVESWGSWPILKLFGRVRLWTALPNRRSACFFNS